MQHSWMEPWVCFPKFPSTLQWDRGVKSALPLFSCLREGCKIPKCGFRSCPLIKFTSRCATTPLNKTQLQVVFFFFHFGHTGMERERGKICFQRKKKCIEKCFSAWWNINTEMCVHKAFLSLHFCVTQPSWVQPVARPWQTDLFQICSGKSVAGRGLSSVALAHLSQFLGISDCHSLLWTPACWLLAKGIPFVIPNKPFPWFCHRRGDGTLGRHSHPG